MNFIFSFLFLLVFMSMLYKMGHLLAFLVGLEMLGLYFFILWGSASLVSHMDSLLLLFFIVVLAMESVVGLVLLVSYVRFWGKDYIFLLSSLKW